LLGDVDPKEGEPRVVSETRQVGEAVDVRRVLLETEPGTLVPLVLLSQPKGPVGRRLVVMLAAEGKQALLRGRAAAVAALLDGGAVVCLPDLRGTGETRPGDGRGRQSAATSISSSELMLGQTLVGSRLRDLRCILKHLRRRKDIGIEQIALWGDSLAPANPADRDLKVPLDADRQPDLAEPLGGVLALLGALFENDVKAVHVRGGLSGYRPVLDSPFVNIPHDVVVPGALTAGDLCDVAAALAPRPLRLEGLVDGLNRRVRADDLAKTYEPATAAYRAAKAEKNLQLAAEPDGAAAAKWLLDNLTK
jgi:hypothetical protein